MQYADPQNPQFDARIWDLSEIRAELWQILCENYQIFVTMATGVGLTQISLSYCSPLT